MVISLSISKEHNEMLKTLAKASGKTKSQYISYLLEKDFSNKAEEVAEIIQDKIIPLFKDYLGEVLEKLESVDKKIDKATNEY